MPIASASAPIPASSKPPSGIAGESGAADEALLRAISQRVLWLSTAIVDAANRGRPNSSGVKVGGHQASSASMVDVMVALWFHSLGRNEATTRSAIALCDHKARVMAVTPANYLGPRNCQGNTEYHV
jgi:pyruvate dehydrogenase complex dehydrogenase (E1) component